MKAVAPVKQGRSSEGFSVAIPASIPGLAPGLAPPRFSASPERPPEGVVSPSPVDVAGGPDSNTQGRSEGLWSREDAHPGLTPRNSVALVAQLELQAQ